MLLWVTPAMAALLTVGKGETLTFDERMIPPQYVLAFKIMKVRCIKCHTMERTVVAIRSGIAPITGGEFSHKATKAYGIKMLRKKDSGMNKQEVGEVVELLNYLLAEAEKK